jgi:predicted enzyme related to lactoylglutathione lyase
MDHPTFGNGKICYIEIPSNDINSSAAFYETVFGWIIRRDDNGNISFDDAVGVVCGMWVVGRKPATEIGLIISIMVYDIMATIDLIIANGGKILDIDVDSKEKTARFSDPTGNIFVLYQHGKNN